MYSQHFNFSSRPFSIAPNPRYVYLSPQHREALAHLLYGISSGGGFVALTGEVGTGKTTLCRCLLESVPEDVEIAVIFNPRLNSRELLAGICDELRIPYPQHRASLKLLIDLLNSHLLEVHARGKRTVVLIDEAQNLSFDVLEQIRLLTNLETNDSKLLQIILVGQPELNELLRRRNLRQLSQRITARYHLRPLSWRDTAAYIRHRIAVSGGTRKVFSASAVFMIYRLSGGIPRVINLICDRALLGAYTLGKTEAGCAIVRKAAGEVLPAAATRYVSPALAVSAAATLALYAGFAYFGGIAYFAPKAVLEKPADASARPETRGKFPQSQAGMQKAHAGQPQPDGKSSSKAELKAAVLPAAPKAAFAELLADTALTRPAAFARLLSLWRVAAPPGITNECALAGRSGLRCLFQTGSWVQLRNLDTPAILEFELSDGSKRYATLAGMSNEKVRLYLGERSHDFEPADILPYWRGNAILLWKPPRNNMEVIKRGDKGEGVKWLRERLGATTQANRESYFDARLQAQVVAFQKQHGLFPDGIAGALTIILLNRKTQESAVLGGGSKEQAAAN
jgi:general secretion pathway protein A